MRRSGGRRQVAAARGLAQQGSPRRRFAAPTPEHLASPPKLRRVEGSLRSPPRRVATRQTPPRRPVEEPAVQNGEVAAGGGVAAAEGVERVDGRLRGGGAQAASTGRRSGDDADPAALTGAGKALGASASGVDSGGGVGSSGAGAPLLASRAGGLGGTRTGRRPPLHRRRSGAAAVGAGGSLGRAPFGGRFGKALLRRRDRGGVVAPAGVGGPHGGQNGVSGAEGVRSASGWTIPTDSAQLRVVAKTWSTRVPTGASLALEMQEEGGLRMLALHNAALQDRVRAEALKSSRSTKLWSELQRVGKLSPTSQLALDPDIGAPGHEALGFAARLGLKAGSSRRGSARLMKPLSRVRLMSLFDAAAKSTTDTSAEVSPPRPPTRNGATKSTKRARRAATRVKRFRERADQRLPSPLRPDHGSSATVIPKHTVRQCDLGRDEFIDSLLVAHGIDCESACVSDSDKSKRDVTDSGAASADVLARSAPSAAAQSPTESHVPEAPDLATQQPNAAQEAAVKSAVPTRTSDKVPIMLQRAAGRCPPDDGTPTAAAPHVRATSPNSKIRGTGRGFAAMKLLSSEPPSPVQPSNRNANGPRGPRATRLLGQGKGVAATASHGTDVAEPQPAEQLQQTTQRSGSHALHGPGAKEATLSVPPVDEAQLATTATPGSTVNRGLGAAITGSGSQATKQTRPAVSEKGAAQLAGKTRTKRRKKKSKKARRARRPAPQFGLGSSEPVCSLASLTMLAASPPTATVTPKPSTKQVATRRRRVVDDSSSDSEDEIVPAGKRARHNSRGTEFSPTSVSQLLPSPT